MPRAKVPKVEQTVERLTELSVELRRLQDAALALTGERDELVGHLRDAGWSLGQIAKVSGLTRGRVAQILGKSP